MSDDSRLTANELAERRTAMATDRTDLALERSMMAARRTMMAWVRTALSLIGFGFTIYKFLQAETQGAKLALIQVQGPRRLGLFLIALGTTSVVMGGLEYFGTIRRLNAMSGSQRRAVDYSLLMGGVIALLGVILFVTIFANAEVF